MSAVKNLRAMFEQKADSSPPDRGRSPGLSSNGTETPPLSSTRPLSKIRTSFVAVEKDGRVGLRRDPSNESSVSQRRLSSHTEGEASVSGLSDKTMATEDTSGGYKTNIVGSPIPESPRRPDADKPTNGASPRSLGALNNHPSHNTDKHVDIETPTPELLPGDPTQMSPDHNVSNGTAAAKTAGSTAPKNSTKTTTKPLAKLAPPATITRAKTPLRSPVTAKTPITATGGSKPSAPKAQHDAAKKPAEKPATSTPKSAAKTAGAGKKPAPVQVSPSSGIGFVKPKVKSPTKPVKLPASLMAPTAASVQRVKEAPRETLTRASGSQGRPASRASAPGAAAPPKTLKRQNSVINRPRPSIGPPPKKPLQDHPITKKDKEVDEGFLARMMRPTASSTSKVSEKAPVTPPRSRSAKPSSAKKASASRSPKRALSRPAAVRAGSRTGSPFASKKDAPVKNVVETAEAEAIAEAPRTPEVKAPATPEPIIEETAAEPSPAKEAEAEAPVEEKETTVPELEAVTEERVEEPELDDIIQQTATLDLKEEDAEDQELKSPDEFEELLADEKEAAEEDKTESTPAPVEATTEVKTETA
ncbi:uncharacterized protein CCOS01_14602 [Colletotrichum costaricense]|uniref:Mucin-7 n=1 Tax=Colletotrichum costaricense TaxID=1209916 RepID=A0AAI9YIY5_9PEZI|nr:uncharacterized protein CCOS01_14602 [Colletotrichum costaricense]KAK1512362.1 hypothetical protein CCOS01_14602 [Colletotrichum costaricense]